ncbi:MAG: phosphoribosylformylglycinamidine cyclo-ligase [Actinomycetota bacterium]|nr:phosphoribosylformylglycinamidine cyclo-ligase [Actinomycetota bacterium]
MSASTYERAGVRGQDEALSAVVRHLGPTFSLPEGAEVLTDFGHYASVLRIAEGIGLAICTDGVGSKTIVASRMARYDTIGFDCVAMNVNDLICVGATPIAMVDYLGVHTLDPERVDAILGGLGAAAKEAGIAIPGGELAQLPEVIGSDGRSHGDETAFDLVGTSVGVVAPDAINVGAKIQEGDAIVGLHSSGMHSNGFTLARRVLLSEGGLTLKDSPGGLDRSLGDELLEPTTIYVQAVKGLWRAGIDTRGLAHITGDGLLNLCRLEAKVGYDIEALPVAPSIFGLIQERGGIEDAEMFRVFNMGIGFVIIVPDNQVDDVLRIASEHGHSASRIGTVSDERGIVRLRERHLAGSLESGAFS